MVIIGADLHKRTPHARSRSTSTGRKLGGEDRGAATLAGHLEVRRWAAAVPGADVARWRTAVTSRADSSATCVAAGEAVVRVPRS